MAMFVLLLLSTLLYTAHVYANLYVLDPPGRRVCHGNQPCTISWLDDGEAPLLDIIRICYVALYNGERRLIQQIDPVDVSAARSLTFTPSPNAGPNSDTYYVNFTSLNPVSNGPYHQYSSFFTIDNMSGSFDSPVPSLTSAIPVPSTLLTPPPPSTPPPSTSSGMSTSRISPTATPPSSTSFSSSSSLPTSVPSDQNSAFNVLPRCSKSTIAAISILSLALFDLC